MADNKKTPAYEEDANIGKVQLSDEVVVVISGIAATEVPGVASLVGNVTKEDISKVGAKKLARGIKVHMNERMISVNITIEINFGYNVPDVCSKVQQKVSQAIENMTGLRVADINVFVADITIPKNI